MNHSLSKEQWQALRNLRLVFLGESPKGSSVRTGEYWGDSELLELYDCTFGERIGSKWDAVTQEIQSKNLAALFESLPIIDFGCGSGVASRRWLTAFPPTPDQKILLVDRSKMAMSYAMHKLRALGPECDIQLAPRSAEIPKDGLVLASHVINELAFDEVNAFQKALSQSAAFVWVEPGTKEAAAQMGEFREALRTTHDFIAPCPHNAVCGMGEPKNERHWCHHFAKPPNQVFQSAFWQRFSSELKIDLRSLPTSYLVGVKKGSASRTLNPNRVIGRARIYKGYVLALLCQTEGVNEVRVMSRHFPATVERLEETNFCESIAQNEVGLKK